MVRRREPRREPSSLPSPHGSHTIPVPDTPAPRPGPGQVAAHALPEPTRGNRTAPSDYAQLSVQYRSAANVLLAALRNDAPPRRTPAGVPLTGAGLAHLLRALVVVAGDEEAGMPAMPDVWQTWEQQLVEVAAKDALARAAPLAPRPTAPLPHMSRLRSGGSSHSPESCPAP